MNQDAVNRMERVLNIVNETAKQKIIQNDRVTDEVQLLLLMKELIKEQVPK